MGIRFTCVNGHKLNVKSYLAGRQGLCPYCGVSVDIPLQSTRESSRRHRTHTEGTVPTPPEPEQFTQISHISQGPSSSSTIPSDSHIASPYGTPNGTTSTGETVAEESTGAAQENMGTAGAQGALESQESQGIPAANPATELPTSASPTSDSSVIWGSSDFSAGKLEITGRKPSAQALEQANAVLTERPASVWYLHQGDAQRGPYLMDSVQEFLQSGQIGADALLWREDWPDWREVQEVFPALFTDDLEQIPPRTPVVTESNSASLTAPPRIAISDIVQPSVPVTGTSQGGATYSTSPTGASKKSPVNGITALVIFLGSLILLAIGIWWMVTRETTPESLENVAHEETQTSDVQ